MTILLITALAVIAMTIVDSWSRDVLVAASGRAAIPRCQRKGSRCRAKAGVIIQTVLFMIVLHFVEILIWAAAYLLVAAEEFDSVEAAIYFSAVTFTTLGYGDITLSSNWRLLSGFEAIGGIVLIGWTTAFLYAVLQRMWQAHVTTTGGTHE